MSQRRGIGILSQPPPRRIGGFGANAGMRDGQPPPLNLQTAAGSAAQAARMQQQPMRAGPMPQQQPGAMNPQVAQDIRGMMGRAVPYPQQMPQGSMPQQFSKDWVNPQGGSMQAGGFAGGQMRDMMWRGQMPQGQDPGSLAQQYAKDFRNPQGGSMQSGGFAGGMNPQGGYAPQGGMIGSAQRAMGVQPQTGGPLQMARGAAQQAAQQPQLQRVSPGVYRDANGQLVRR